MNIGILPERLKEQRNRMKLSQKDLALRIGYKKQAISRWERSKKTVNIRNSVLPALCNALTCTPEYLTGAVSERDKILDDGKTLKLAGMPLNRSNDIREHIRQYSDEQLIFLYDFLKIIDISNSSQLKLIKRVCAAIATVDISATMIRHPLCDWKLFESSFRCTLKTIEKARENLQHAFPRGEIPSSLTEALDRCSQAILDDFNALTMPFQTEKSLKRALKNLTSCFKWLNDTIDKQDTLTVDVKNLLKETSHETLNTALDSDIKKLIQILSKPI